MPDTIFEKILRRDIPAQIFYEDEDVVAFHDIAPEAPLHVLVIPKHKWCSFSNFSDADPLLVGRYMVAVAKVAAHLGLDQNGYRVVFNSGRDAQQSVDYIHAHILGGRSLRWPPG